MERHFHDELNRLNENLLKMAAMAEKAIYDSIESLKKEDRSLARQVIDDDKKIDDMEVAIEESAIGLLALNQPLAGDLRFITTAMRINGELERIADLAVNIAERVLYNLKDGPGVKSLSDITRLAEIAANMVRSVMDAFVKRDKEAARVVIQMDPEADELRNKVYKYLVEDILVKDGSLAPRIVPLLLISRYLERICDHATYIAEDVIYMVEAKLVKHHPEKL
ncbi:MAG TPA: phosphate signaling complex protein PhoU [Candidatus Omnitrophota bacterium]|nr:phosphate signaling complex protein PhoU [Candidatus Omnitrophota bacterium]HPS20889.1 phosphate signaling complex protein PhoU [Candidatus Omnitrophota bacterium]